MGRDAPVQQSVAEAKSALRSRSTSIDYLQSVKDNPVKSLGAAFLVGVAMGSSPENKLPSELFSTLLKAAEELL